MDQQNANGTCGVDRLLARLQKVKRSGQQSWAACCPAHDDSHPSLCLRQLADGRILLHCFAGCAVSDVVAAVGMDIADLFPQPLEGVHRRAKVRKPFNPHDVLRCLALDSLTVMQCANIMHRGEALTPSAHASMLEAAAHFLAAESLLDA
jgi:hypothetical protein